MSQRPSPEDYAIGPLLLRAHRRGARAFNAALQPLGIEGRHFGLLAVLQQEGPMSQTQLGARTSHDKSAIVRSIDDLQARGYVERRPDPRDRRAFAVTLTDTGRSAFRQAEVIAVHVADDLFAGIDERDRSELERLLRVFVDAGQADELRSPSATRTR